MRQCRCWRRKFVKMQNRGRHFHNHKLHKIPSENHHNHLCLFWCGHCGHVVMVPRLHDQRFPLSWMANSLLTSMLTTHYENANPDQVVKSARQRGNGTSGLQRALLERRQRDGPHRCELDCQHHLLFTQCQPNHHAGCFQKSNYQNWLETSRFLSC